MESTDPSPNQENTNTSSQINICDYCHIGFDNIDVFSCGHKICAVCLFRRIFILNITELNGSSSSIKIKCNKCAGGTLSKNLDDLLDIISIKISICQERNENPSSYNADNSNKCQEHHLSKDNLSYLDKLSKYFLYSSLYPNSFKHMCFKCKIIAKSGYVSRYKFKISKALSKSFLMSK